MARMKIDDTQLLDRISDVFRRYGYEGASLSRLTEATGLQRASLYHRFPDGKEEMAEAALSSVDAHFADDILAPLFEPGEPGSRVRRMATRLKAFHDEGRKACVLDTMSLGDRDDPPRAHVQQSFEAWIAAMTKIAREAGFTPAMAKRRAEESLVQIQGALVFSRATGDRKPFERVIHALPDLLTGVDR